jgi:hypothetical protein
MVQKVARKGENKCWRVISSNIPRALRGCAVEWCSGVGGATAPKQTWRAAVAEVALGGVAQALQTQFIAVPPSSGFLRCG